MSNRLPRPPKSYRSPRKAPPLPADVERLVSVAIIRDGETHHGGRSHWELRHHLGDADPSYSRPGDQEGFWTSKDRFVDRQEAILVALGARQISRPQQRELLSSDVRW